MDPHANISDLLSGQKRFIADVAFIVQTATLASLFEADLLFMEEVASCYQSLAQALRPVYQSRDPACVTV